MITPADGPLLLAFSAVARLGSFSAAAAELKLSKSVVSERVKELEERCAARLLERTTRRQRLTAAGADVLTVARGIEDALGLLAQRLETQRHEPAGVLRVSTTNDLGPLLVGPVAARLLNAHPQVRIEIIAEDARRDVLADHIDVAIRLGAPGTTSFVVRKLAMLREPIVAAPALAERFGGATRPRELVDAPWVRHGLLAAHSLRFTGPRGAVDDLTPCFRAEANSGSTLLSLLLHGAGVGVLPEHALREHLHDGRLVELCPGWTWKQVALYALMPSRTSQKPALKVFLAMLAEQLAADRLRWPAATAG